MHFCIITIHNASSPAIKTLGAQEEVHVSQRERKAMGASEREEGNGSQWARGRPCWPVSERKTMGASEREEDHGSQWARGRPCWPVKDLSLYIFIRYSLHVYIIYILLAHMLYIYYMYMLYIYITCTYVMLYIHYMYILYIFILHVHMSSYNYYIVRYMSLLIKQKKL